ncbi:hypothetical protein ABID65_006698 [Bradyrhizobium sp. S3.9.2]|uniref:DUF7178 family protein n=1 Tax=Bradyrhizobium sp. S3.9.2 TaxID=3156432 RepID=UPI0033930C9D
MDPLSLLRERFAQPDGAALQAAQYQDLLARAQQADAPKKSVFDWSGVGEAMPESIGRGKILDPIVNSAMSMATLPKRAMESSQRMVETGQYDPAPILEAAMLPMGGGAMGAPMKAGEAVLGAGPIKKLFDYSKLGEVPNVPQFDLPRNIPPRGVPQRTLDVVNDPTVRQKMLEVISQGKEMGGANWYNADPLREAFVNELGSSGEGAFRKYMDMVAATSPRSEVGANARNASYYYGRAMRGEDMPEVGTPNPQPYGHLAQRLHQMNAERVAAGGWDALNNPKPASFVENLTGNQQPVTVDTHAFRLPAILARDPRFLETAFQVGKDAPKQNIPKMLESGEISMEDAASRPAFWQAQPKANEYAAMERYYQSLGKDLGLTPAQTQASAWVGGGKLTGLASDESKPFLRFLEDRIEKTAEKRGVTTKQALADFIRGREALYSLAPLGALPLLRPQERQ